MKRGRLDRHGADRVVGAVIAASFVDRQKLHEFKAALSRPVDELAQRCDVTDAKIILAAQREERREDASDSLFRRKFIRKKMTNDE